MPVPRNYHLEKVVESRVVKCPHGDCEFRGCLRDRATQNHIAKCPRRPLRCPWPNCPFEGPTDELLNHLKDHHNARELGYRVKFGEPLLICLCVREDDPATTSDRGVVFYAGGWAYYTFYKCDRRLLSVSVWPLFHVSEDTADTVTLHSDDFAGRRKYEYSGTVCPCNENALLAEDGLCIPYQVIEQHRQGSLLVRVRISRS